MAYMQSESGRIFTTSSPEYHKNDKKLTKKEGEKLYIEQCKNELLELVKPNDKIYINVVSVSNSGMSRKMTFHIVQGKEIRNITHLVSIVAGYNTDNNYNLKVSGCGMDMGFSVVYNLGRCLWRDGTPESHGTRNGVADFDGGYALKHSYI